MSTAPFDTFKLSRSLQGSFTTEQAEGIAAGLADAAALGRT
jgi:hypothetical protein